MRMPICQPSDAALRGWRRWVALWAACCVALLALAPLAGHAHAAHDGDHVHHVHVADHPVAPHDHDPLAPGDAPAGEGWHWHEAALPSFALAEPILLPPSGARRHGWDAPAPGVAPLGGRPIPPHRPPIA